MGVLSEMDGSALCYPAFPLVVPLRKTYKDGVNLPIQVQPSVLACPMRVVQSGAGEPLAYGASLSTRLPMRDPREHGAPWTSGDSVPPRGNGPKGMASRRSHPSISSP